MHAANLPVCSYNGYRAQRYRCPLLFHQSSGQACAHEQFAKGKGCVKDINAELGGQMRVTLDHTSPLYHVVYVQRISTERINSHAKADGASNAPKCAIAAQWRT